MEPLKRETSFFSSFLRAIFKYELSYYIGISIVNDRKKGVIGWLRGKKSRELRGEL